MTILVTGGLGFIGSNTILQLYSSGYEVVIVDNLSNSEIKTLEVLKSYLKRDIVFYRADVRDFEALDKIFSKYNFLAVIHFAGLKSVSESVSNPLGYFDNNIIGTISLLKAMQKHECEFIIFSSSASVYGETNILPISEDSNLKATNPYAESKLIIEYILSSMQTNSFKIGILRYFNPVGGHRSHLFGEKPIGKPNNLMPYICQVAAGNVDFLEVFGGNYDTPDGTGVRDYIHVTDLARGHIDVLKYLSLENNSITVNLGTGSGFSVIDVIKTFEKVNKVSVPYKITPRRPGDVPSCYADTEFARKVLGWKAKYGLAEMCMDSWLSFKQQ